MKGKNLEEIKEAEKNINLYNGKIERIEKLILPNTDIERNILILRKIK